MNKLLPLLLLVPFGSLADEGYFTESISPICTLALDDTNSSIQFADESGTDEVPLITQVTTNILGNNKLSVNLHTSTELGDVWIENQDGVKLRDRDSFISEQIYHEWVAVTDVYKTSVPTDLYDVSATFVVDCDL